MDAHRETIPDHADDGPNLLGLRKAKRLTVPEAAPKEVKMDVKLAVALASVETNSEGDEK